MCRRARLGAEREEVVGAHPLPDRFQIGERRQELGQPRPDQPQCLAGRQPLEVHLELGQPVPGRVLNHARLPPAEQRRLDAGRHRQQVRRGVDQGFEEAGQRGELLVVQVVHLIEGQHERPARRGRQPRQGDEHLLDLLVVGQRHRLPGCDGTQLEPRRLIGFQRLAGQPTQRQRRRLAVFLARAPPCERSGRTGTTPRKPPGR